MLFLTKKINSEKTDNKIKTSNFIPATIFIITLMPDTLIEELTRRK